MVLNQQLTKEESLDFYEKITDLLDGFIPYTTTYLEMKESGWNKGCFKKNKYVSEVLSDEEPPYIKQYHNAWSTFTKKKELIQFIKDCKYLDTIPALDILEKVTGISEKKDLHKIKIDGKEIEISEDSYEELKKSLLK